MESMEGTHIVHPSYKQCDDHKCPDNNGTRGPNTIGEYLRINILRCYKDGRSLRTYSSHRLTYGIFNDNLQITSSVEGKDNIDNCECQVKDRDVCQEIPLLTPSHYRTQDCCTHNRKRNSSRSISCLFANMNTGIKTRCKRCK